MKWIQRYLSQNDIQRVSQAVQEAETKTSGEIVPVIVQRSSTVGHVPLALTLLFLVAALFVEFPTKDLLFIRPWIYVWPFLAVTFFFLAQFFSRSTRIQRMLTPNQDEVAQVYQRAQLEFYLNRVNMTTSSTGILIFISVMERRAVILADQGIAQKIPQETWQKIVNSLTFKLRKGQWSPGLLTAIHDCGEILTTHFPIESHTKNELSNQLVVKE